MANSDGAAASTLDDLLQKAALDSVPEEDYQYLVMYMRQKVGGRPPASGNYGSFRLEELPEVLETDKEASFFTQQFRYLVSLEDWKKSDHLELPSTKGERYYILGHPHNLSFEELMSHARSEYSHILGGSKTAQRYDSSFIQSLFWSAWNRKQMSTKFPNFSGQVHGMCSSSLACPIKTKLVKVERMIPFSTTSSRNGFSMS
jgi:hypothetical protein